MVFKGVIMLSFLWYVLGTYRISVLQKCLASARLAISNGLERRLKHPASLLRCVPRPHLKLDKREPRKVLYNGLQGHFIPYLSVLLALPFQYLWCGRGTHHSRLLGVSFWLIFSGPFLYLSSCKPERIPEKPERPRKIFEPLSETFEADLLQMRDD